MKYIVDRIEGNIVVLENQESKKMENFAKELFPEDIKTGDLVEKQEDGKFVIKKEETERIRKEINDMITNFFKNKD